jgi:toxin-antitoxin system PIN domain toxin
VIAVDTNILVYAHRADSKWNERAYESIGNLAQGTATWAVPWACVGEFVAVVTNGRIFPTPTPLDAALRQVDIWLKSPPLVLLSEPVGFWPTWRAMLEDAKLVGRRTYDVRIAAICMAHGVRELWTADRDYGRFPGLRTRNPLVA